MTQPVNELSKEVTARYLVNELFQDTDNEARIPEKIANAICDLHARKFAHELTLAEERGYQRGIRDVIRIYEKFCYEYDVPREIAFLSMLKLLSPQPSKEGKA